MATMNEKNGVSPKVKKTQDIAQKFIKNVNPSAAKAIKQRKKTMLETVSELERMEKRNR